MHRRLFLLACHALSYASCTPEAAEVGSTVRRECDSASLVISDPCHIELLQRKVDIYNSAADDVTSFPSLGLVKTHKTASTTMMFILSNLAEKHDLARMFPSPTWKNCAIGWPGPFPGNESLATAGPPMHQYGFIGNHAVFNSALFRAYLGPNPYFVTVLREPTSQAVSSYNFYICRRLGCQHSWDEHLTSIESFPTVHPTWRDDERFMAYYVNPQSWDLGWYEFLGRYDVVWTQYDRNATRVEEWLSTLDEDFGTPASVVMTEHFDEGMVLLQRHLGHFGVTLNDVAYLLQNEGASKKVEPSKEEYARLAKLFPVDRALYDRYNATFWSQWQIHADPELEASLQQIQRLNAQLEALCYGSNEDACPLEWRIRGGDQEQTSLKRNQSLIKEAMISD